MHQWLLMLHLRYISRINHFLHFTGLCKNIWCYRYKVDRCYKYCTKFGWCVFTLCVINLGLRCTASNQIFACCESKHWIMTLWQYFWCKKWIFVIIRMIGNAWQIELWTCGHRPNQMTVCNTKVNNSFLLILNILFSKWEGMSHNLPYPSRVSRKF